MASIAIIGPGAIGGILATWLTQSGRHTVKLHGRRPLPVLRVETPAGELTLESQVVTSPAHASQADFVLVATKSYDAEAASRWFSSLVGPQTVVAILQNGVEHINRFSPYVAPARILPVIVMIAVERLEPSRLLHRGTAKLSVPDGTAGRSFADLFAGTPVELDVTADFKTIMWRKLAGNAPGILNAILLQPTRAYQDNQLAALARSIAEECVAVGRAEGATLDDDVPDAVVRGLHRAPPDSINSMHADRIAGRPLEIDARNGVIVRLGAKHGIPTPVNNAAVILLEAMTRPAP